MSTLIPRFLLLVPLLPSLVLAQLAPVGPAPGTPPKAAPSKKPPTLPPSAEIPEELLKKLRERAAAQQAEKAKASEQKASEQKASEEKAPAKVVPSPPPVVAPSKAAPPGLVPDGNVSAKDSETLKVTPERVAEPPSGRAGAFERYKIIFQKQPFGAPPEEVAETAPAPPPAEPDWIKDYRLSMLREAKNGTLLAGLVKKQDNKSITLQVGDKHEGEGIELVSIDMAASEIKLKKGSAVLALKVDPEDFKIGGAKKAPKPGSRTSSRSSGRDKSKYSDFAKRMAERRAELAAKAQQNKKPPPPSPKRR